jgi:hypothetical protein
MAAQGTISKLTSRIDDLTRRLGVGTPLYCVCGTAPEGSEVVAQYRAEHPEDEGRLIHIIATGVARRYSPTVQ